MNDVELKKVFGKKIKELRENFNISQEELSVELGITQRQVSMIERGLSFPQLKTLNKISNVFNCSLSDLFDNEYLQTENVIKTKLNDIINNCDYNKLKTLYLIAKNL